MPPQKPDGNFPGGDMPGERNGTPPVMPGSTDKSPDAGSEESDSEPEKPGNAGGAPGENAGFSPSAFVLLGISVLVLAAGLAFAVRKKARHSIQ